MHAVHEVQQKRETVIILHTLHTDTEHLPGVVVCHCIVVASNMRCHLHRRSGIFTDSMSHHMGMMRLCLSLHLPHTQPRSKAKSRTGFGCCLSIPATIVLVSTMSCMCMYIYNQE